MSDAAPLAPRLETPPGPDSDHLQAMTLIEHLRELRTRLFWVVGAVVVGMLVSLVVSDEVMRDLMALCSTCQYQFIEPLEALTTYLRVALILGFILASPVALFQLVAFILPALHPSERRVLYIALPAVGGLFAAGLAFGRFVVLARTIDFLAGFLASSGSVEPGAGVAQHIWRVGLYISFITNLLFMIGIAFQTPLVVYLLAKLGIVSPLLLRRYRRHAILLMAVLAAIMTPTPDPFTMLMVLSPMVLLYELGILLARYA